MVPDLPHTLVATVLVLSSMCAGPVRGQRPGQVDPLTVTRANPQCWDSSSSTLLEMRSPRIADTVPAFWDMMGSLRSSDNDKHAELFWDLARVFWDLYLDCVMSKSHGLGRRHTSTLHSLVAGSWLAEMCSLYNLNGAVTLPERKALVTRKKKKERVLQNQQFRSRLTRMTNQDPEDQTKLK